MSSLQHILAAEPEPEPQPPRIPPAPQGPAPAQVEAVAPISTTAMPPPGPVNPQAQQEEHQRQDNSTGDDATDPQAPNDDPVYTSTTTSVRRNASGSVSSVYSGNKIRHLKKEDGIPLWRKDIQYEFLRLIFYDKTRCFTKQSDGTSGWTFAETYVDAMAKSSKCSKILKEKLLVDTEGAISMAMVCLLVNVGRMNTTLNCKIRRMSS
jgi:Ino eighty subunit 1